MNIHTKLLQALVKISEMYLQEKGYEYSELDEYNQSCFTKDQFEEIINLTLEVIE